MRGLMHLYKVILGNLYQKHKYTRKVKFQSLFAKQLKITRLDHTFAFNECVIAASYHTWNTCACLNIYCSLQQHNV